MPARKRTPKSSKPTPDPAVVAKRIAKQTPAAKPKRTAKKPPTGYKVGTLYGPNGEDKAKRTMAVEFEDQEVKAGRMKPEDAVNLRHVREVHARGGVEPTRRRARSADGGGSTRAVPTVKWYRAGQLLKDSMHKLSTVAYFFTRGIKGHTDRMPAKEFRSLLVTDFKIAEPETSTWRVVLPNGEDIGAVAPGGKLPELSAADAKKVTAPRRASSTTAAAKAAPTKKAATKKAAAPKKAPAKKAAATAAFKRTRK